MRATERAAFSYRHILSTSERGAVSKVAGGPPTGGPPVINFGLYANVQVEGKTKSKIRTIAIKGPVCGEPGPSTCCTRCISPGLTDLENSLDKGRGGWV